MFITSRGSPISSYRTLGRSSSPSHSRPDKDADDKAIRRPGHELISSRRPAQATIVAGQGYVQAQSAVQDECIED